MAGFIANRFMVLEAQLQASQTQHGTDAAASQQREQQLQAQIEQLQQQNASQRLTTYAAAEEIADLQVARYSTARYCVEYSLAALRLLVDCNLSFEKVQETIVRTLGLHILPGQQLEDRVPCGMTLRRAMDDICHQAHKHQSGLCAQAGAGAIGFDSKGDNLGIIMQTATQKQLDGIATSVELTFVQAQLPARQL
ncbi:hypothetical protein HaLaN_10661, partial [Haematococcus lacustris]